MVMQAVRCATFLGFQNEAAGGATAGSFEGAEGEIGEDIYNIACPFGISSKELFHNLKFTGIIANYLTPLVGILDLNGGDGLLSVEGSPILSSGSDKLLGIRQFHDKLGDYSPSAKIYG